MANTPYKYFSLAYSERTMQNAEQAVQQVQPEEIVTEQQVAKTNEKAEKPIINQNILFEIYKTNGIRI